MARASAAIPIRSEEVDAFDVASDLAVLRRAVAELELPKDTRASFHEAARGVTRLCLLAQAMLVLLGQSPLARRSKELARGFASIELELSSVRLLVESAPGAVGDAGPALAPIRAMLYGVLVRVSEELAELDGLERVLGHVDPRGALGRALSIRWLLSDFHSALPAPGARPADLAWTLDVAEAEIGILVRHRVFAEPNPIGAELAALGRRIARWRSGKRGLIGARKLHEELGVTARLLAELNRRPEVVLHDFAALRRLATLLASGVPGIALAARAAEPLAGLRGLDAELDRLMLELPLDPAATLKAISRRATALNARAIHC